MELTIFVYLEMLIGKLNSEGNIEEAKRKRRYLNKLNKMLNILNNYMDENEAETLINNIVDSNVDKATVNNIILQKDGFNFLLTLESKQIILKAHNNTYKIIGTDY